MANEEVTLESNVQLQGFASVEPAAMTVLRKIIGNHYRRLAEISDAQGLIISMKTIHGIEKSEKYELHARLASKGNRMFTSVVVDRDLFVAIDKLLKKLEAEIEK